MSDDDSKIINVTSHDQKGGITAYQVNFNTKKERHINEEFKVNLNPHLPKKNETIEVNATMSDPEAYQFASEIKSFLEGEGYEVKGVSHVMYARPPVGNIIEQRKEGGIKIIIGTHKS